MIKIFDKKAYALLELVLVLLIITILAAIAFPKYKRILEKAKATQSIVNLKILSESAKRYYMTKGDWTNDLRDLDIEIQGDIGGAEIPGRPYANIATDSFYYILLPDKQGIYAVPISQSSAYGYYMFQIFFENNSIDCMVEDLIKGQPLCKIMGGEEDYYMIKTLGKPFGGVVSVYYFHLNN